MPTRHIVDHKTVKQTRPMNRQPVQAEAQIQNQSPGLIKHPLTASGVRRHPVWPAGADQSRSSDIDGALVAVGLQPAPLTATQRPAEGLRCRVMRRRPAGATTGQVTWHSRKWSEATTHPRTLPTLQSEPARLPTFTEPEAVTARTVPSLSTAGPLPPPPLEALQG